MKRTAFRHFLGPVPAGTVSLFEIFHREADGTGMSASGPTLAAAWQALERKAAGTAPDWVASAPLADALDLPGDRVGRPSNLQAKAVLAAAAALHDGFCDVRDAETRAACLKVFARLPVIATTCPADRTVLFDVRGAGTAIRRGTVAVSRSGDALSLALHPRTPGDLTAGKLPDAAATVDHVRVRPGSGWFAEAVHDAVGVRLDVDIARADAGRTQPLPPADMVLLAAIARALPEDLSRPGDGAGAVASGLFQSVCMLTHLRVVTRV